MFIWFNLLMYFNHQWYYLDSFETLEQCQEAQWEQVAQGEPDRHFYCIPRPVEKT